MEYLVKLSNLYHYEITVASETEEEAKKIALTTLYQKKDSERVYYIIGQDGLEVTGIEQVHE